jgi:hypothetical protein
LKGGSLDENYPRRSILEGLIHTAGYHDSDKGIAGAFIRENIMSVRAHRIIKIKTEDSYTSFSLWHDKKLMEFLDSEADFYSQLTSDGMGITEVSVEVLEKAIDQASELELDTGTVDNLKKDIVWAKAHNEEFVQYYCY